MARPAGSKNKPRLDENGNPIPKATKSGNGAIKAAPRQPRVPKTEAGIGHNSDTLDDDQLRALLMDAVGKIEPMKGKIAKLAGELLNLYKTAKGDGVQKKDIDLAIKLRAQDPEQVRADAARRAKITEWLHPGTQADLFGATEPMDRVYEDGKQAGAEGKDPIAPAHFASQASRWLEGWHAGQSINVSGIKELVEDDEDIRPAFLQNGEDPLSDVEAA